MTDVSGRAATSRKPPGFGPGGSDRDTGAIRGVSDTRHDLFVLAAIAVLELVLGWPVITGAYGSYLDNPAHLAEIASLAAEGRGGWSDIAFCGYPAGLLHSPPAYGALAWLARLGIDVGVLYGLALWLAACAPPMAIYRVARAHIGSISAGALAWLLAVQAPANVGAGAVFGGMWTYFAACGVLILLIGRLARPGGGRRRVATIAALVGFIGLVHLFVAVATTLALVVHAIYVVRSGVTEPRRRAIGRDTLAVLVGGLAAAAYGVPSVLVKGALVVEPQFLDPARLAARLFLPTDILDLLSGGPAFDARLFFLEALPMLGLGAVGLAGGVRAFRRGGAPVSRYGFVLALVVVVVLIILHATRFDLLGPVPWRLVYIVRVGLALAAVELFRGRPAPTARARRLFVPAAGLAVHTGLLWGAPLRARTAAPDGPELAEVEGLWAWMRDHAGDLSGRVYLQDTYMTPPLDGPLARSHVLARTRTETGVDQLGAFYGVAPFRTTQWTRSEFGTLFQLPIAKGEHLTFLDHLLDVANARHVVTSDERTAAVLRKRDGWKEVHRSGRFSVLRRPGGDLRWAAGDTDEVRVEVGRWAPGHVEVTVDASVDGRMVLLKQSAHPFWRIEAGPPAELTSNRLGLMILRGFPKGRHAFRLRYDPPAFPGALSVVGWLIILALQTGRWRPRILRRRPPAARGA